MPGTHTRGHDERERGIVFFARCAFPFADRNRVAAVKLHCWYPPARFSLSLSLPLYSSKSVGGREETDSRGDDSASRAAGRNVRGDNSVDNVGIPEV